jgi:cell division protein FtsB
MTWWIKFGCFLTGYNYSILAASSEVSAKSVKKYTAAMLIVCILWSFIGFVFTYRYLKTDIPGAIVGATVLCIIIIQIERQIIMSVYKNWRLYLFRSLIAITMAFIGSIIIDQIIFKEDIEQGKILTIDAKVNKILPGRATELRDQINQLSTAINNKDSERKLLTDDISQHPMIKSFTSQSNTVAIPTSTTDSNKNTSTKIKLVKTNSVTINSIANPKIVLLSSLDQQITALRIQKSKKDSVLLTLRPMIEKEIKSNTGFLDELQIMYNIIKGSGIAMFVWLLWLFFLMGIEMFIMFSKWGDKENDYDLTIKHHMELQRRKLNILAQSVPLELTN